MASIQWSSALMTNMVPAVPVANNTRFSACLDSTGQRPAVFGTSNHEKPQLQLVKENHEGVRQSQNFGKLLGIDESTAVQAFDVRQATDLSIYMVVAVKYSETKSSILVVKPFQLTDDPFLVIAPIQQLATVYQVFLGAPVASSQYPGVILTYQRMDRISKGSDVVQIDVELKGQEVTWSTSSELRLPVNVEKVLDITPVYSETLGKARGVYALCEVQQTKKLYATYVWGATGERRYRDVELPCEDGATCIESYVDKANGSTALIVGGAQGLWNYQSSQVINPESSGKLAYSDALFRGTRHLAIAQDGKDLSVFANNSDGAMAYVRSTMGSFQTGTDIGYYLTSNGQSSNFAATIVHPAGDQDMSEMWNTLVSVDDSGNLSVVQQSTDTGIWKSEPYYVANLEENMDVPSYTISIRAFLEEGRPAAGGSVYIRAATPTAAIVNGKQTNIVSAGQWLPVDEFADMTVIVATNGVAGRVLTLEQVRDPSGVSTKIQPVIMDPSVSIIKTLADITDFGNAVGAQTGEPLYPAVKPPDEDLKAAVTAFGGLATALKEVPEDGSLKTATSLDDSDIGDWIMDGWNRVRDTADKVIKWVVERAGDFWRFVCKIAGETKRFVLNCVEKIGEAASWVFEKIKLGWDKLVDLAGFLFKWKDIVATKKTVASFFSAGLDLTSEKILGADKKVDEWISGLQEKLGDRKDADPAPISIKKVNSTKGQSVDAQHSTAFKWAFERIKNGGKGSDTLIKREDGTMEPNDTTWKSVFEPLLDSIVNLATDAADDLSKLFRTFDSFTTAELWKKLGADFLFNVLEVIKKMIHAILASVAKLIQLFKKTITGKIKIPIITKIWEGLSSEPASLFNILCFVIAIPATILTKLIIGKPPPIFPPINAALLDSILGFSSNPLVTPQTQLDFATFSAGVTTSIVSYKGLYQTIRIGYGYISGDTGTVLTFLTPGMAMKIITIILDVAGVLHTFPTDTSVPGYNLRLATSILGVVRCTLNVLLISTPLGGAIGEEKNLVIDAITTMVNWGLYQAVYYHELDDTAWKDYDRDVTNTSVAASLMDLMAGTGNFLAFFAKAEPPVSAAGVVLMNIGNTGMFVTDGVVFHKTYEKGRRTMLVAPAL